MANTISHSDNVIDSRDVIARIEELESLIAGEEISEDNGAEPQLDDNGATKVDMVTCGTCGLAWNDALISGSTPAPSARCPYESIHEEIEELTALTALADEASGYAADWHHGETIINDDYFDYYARELAEDCGMVKANASWPNNHIDWAAAADELKGDYTAVEFSGTTFRIR